eukprot:jgi/Undpi1/5532/HiC_scaffold_2.g00809.m1
MADHMITTYREKGEKWVHQAEKAQRRMYAGALTRFKFQDASCYLEQAAQCFRIAKRFQDAGVAYKQCGRMEEKLKKPEVAASFYHQAALCFRKDDPQEATACYLNSINLYCQTQLFATAARLEGDVAELMLKDRNRSLAIAHYVKAADFYRANTTCGKATDRCLLKAAYELGLFEKYVEAAALFEEVGRRMLVDELLKFNSPDTFLRAVLCLLCASQMPEITPTPRPKPGVDPSLSRPTLNSVKAKILSFGKINSVFQGSRAYLFAVDMVLVGEEGDYDLFAARVYAYNNVCRLDAWYLRTLKTIAAHVEAKSVKLRKLRAAQDKLRRKQLAAERMRESMKSRQARAMQSKEPRVGSKKTRRSSTSKSGGKKTGGSSDGTASSSESRGSGSERSKSARAEEADGKGKVKKKTKLAKSGRSQESGSESGYSVGGSESVGSKESDGDEKLSKSSRGVKGKKANNPVRKSKTAGDGKVKSAFWRKK